MTNYKLDFRTPEQIVYIGPIKSVQFKGTEGCIEVMNNHSPFITSIKASFVKIKLDNSEEITTAFNAVVRVANDEVTILAESAEKTEEIDLDRATKAKERAESLLHSQKKDIDLIRAEFALKRALMRLELRKK